MFKVTVAEYTVLYDKAVRGEIPFADLNKYKIVADFEPVGNKIVDWCLHSSYIDNGNLLYFGGHFPQSACSFSTYVRSCYSVESVFQDGHRSVWADKENLYIYTFCEHDISVEKFNSLEALEQGVLEAKEFYAIY